MIRRLLAVLSFINGCGETTGITVETAKEILADAGEKECEDGEGRKTNMNQEGIDKRSLDGELRSVALLIRVSQYQWNSKLAFFLLDQAVRWWLKQISTKDRDTGQDQGQLLTESQCSTELWEDE
ncbi:uncharacterized protein AB9X84_024698 isoform 1-T1 [Acanthopagrus schlegelii]